MQTEAMVANHVSLHVPCRLLKAALARVWHSGPECDCARCLEDVVPFRGSCLTGPLCWVQGGEDRAVFPLFREFVYGGILES